MKNLIIYKIYNKPKELLYYNVIEDNHPFELIYKYKRGKISKDLMISKKNIFTHNPRTAYDFANEVLKGRFPEGEEAIAKDATFSLFYALNVIRSRFPEGEEAIKSNEETTNFYNAVFGISL